MIESLIAVAVLGQPTSSGQAPIVDRSGAALLQSIVETMGKLERVDVSITRESRESRDELFVVSRTVSLEWGGAGKFRMEATEYWGGAYVAVSDGKTLMEDPCDLSAPITLKATKMPIWTASDQLGVRGGMSAAWIYLTGGTEKVKEWITDKNRVVLSDPPGPLNGVTMDTELFGTMSIYFDERSQSKRIVQLEFDNFPERKRMSEMWPEWVAPPVPGALDIETIQYRDWPKGKGGSFSVAVPQGLIVDDQTKAKPR